METQESGELPLCGYLKVLNFDTFLKNFKRRYVKYTAPYLETFDDSRKARASAAVRECIDLTEVAHIHANIREKCITLVLGGGARILLEAESAYLTTAWFEEIKRRCDAAKHVRNSAPPLLPHEARHNGHSSSTCPKWLNKYDDLSQNEQSIYLCSRFQQICQECTISELSATDLLKATRTFKNEVMEKYNVCLELERREVLTRCMSLVDLKILNCIEEFLPQGTSKDTVSPDVVVTLLQCIDTHMDLRRHLPKDNVSEGDEDGYRDCFKLLSQQLIGQYFCHLRSEFERRRKQLIDDIEQQISSCACAFPNSIEDHCFRYVDRMNKEVMTDKHCTSPRLIAKILQWYLNEAYQFSFALVRRINALGAGHYPLSNLSATSVSIECVVYLLDSVESLNGIAASIRSGHRAENYLDNGTLLYFENIEDEIDSMTDLIRDLANELTGQLVSLTIRGLNSTLTEKTSPSVVSDSIGRFLTAASRPAAELKRYVPFYFVQVYVGLISQYVLIHVLTLFFGKPTRKSWKNRSILGQYDKSSCQQFVQTVSFQIYQFVNGYLDLPRLTKKEEFRKNVEVHYLQLPLHHICELLSFEESNIGACLDVGLISAKGCIASYVKLVEYVLKYRNDLDRHTKEYFIASLRQHWAIGESPRNDSAQEFQWQNCFAHAITTLFPPHILV